MDPQVDGEIHLHESWGRLELLCRRLWDADSPLALELQALVEEFKGESHRAEQAIVSLRHAQARAGAEAASEKDHAYSAKLRELELRLRQAEDQNAAHESELAKKEAHSKDLLEQLASRKAQNLEFQEKFLASIADLDEARAKKMEHFYQELKSKEESLESRWEARHAELEADFRSRSEALKKRHEELLEAVRARAVSLEEHGTKREAELDGAVQRFQADREAWDKERMEKQAALSKREAELAEQAERLAEDYRKKQAELARLKSQMQAELSEVVRQYQDRMRKPGSQ